MCPKELNLDYDGKRDRWNGFQPDDYKQVIEESQLGMLGGSSIFELNELKGVQRNGFTKALKTTPPSRSGSGSKPSEDA